MLSETKILRLATLSKRYMVCDSECLYIEVLPSGSKAWIFRQRQKKSAIKKVIGHYPDMSLHEARAARDALRQSIEKMQVRKMTFKELALQRMSKKVTGILSARHAQKLLSRFERLIFPAIGSVPAAELTALDVLKLVQKIENDVSAELAHSVLGMISQVLRFGVPLEVLTGDVTRDIKDVLKPVVLKHRASLTGPSDIGSLMRAIDALPSGVIKCAFLVQACTFVRPGELRKAEWTEMDFTQGLWRVPAKKMKMRRPHIVPLSRQVLRTLTELRALTGSSRYIFTLRSNAPISDVTLLKTLRQMGFSKDRMSMHGFRSIASTSLNENGWPSDLIELQLAHAESNSVRAAYNFAEHLEKRRDMMQWYSDYLEALANGKATLSMPFLQQ